MALGPRKVDFSTGPILPAFVRYVIPIILSDLLHLMFNTADVVVVGKFVSDAAQAAVSSTTTMISTMICLVSGLGAGVGVLTARYVGGGEEERTGRVVHTAICAALVLGSGFAAMCMFAVPWALKLMKFPAEVMGPALTYLRIYFVGLPIQLFYNFGAAVLRAQGDSRRPMYYLIIGGIINVATNLVMVLGFGSGVEGVAVATVMSYVVSAGLVCRCLMLETGGAHLDFHRLSIHWPTLGRIAAIGVPAGLQGMMFSLSGALLQSSLNTLGTTVVAGAGVGGNISQYINMIGNAASGASVTFAGQNLGAGKPERIREGHRRIALVAMGISLLAGAAALLLAPWLLTFYTNDPAVVEQGLIQMRVMVPFYIVYAFMQVTQGFQRGMGATLFPMVISAFGTCGLRVLWAMTVFPLRPSLALLMAVYPITWTVTGLAQYIHLRWYTPRAFAERERERAQA